MRSREGITQRLGTATRSGRTTSPATRHWPAAVRFSPYQSARHSRATGAASGTPSLSPVLQGDEGGGARGLSGGNLAKAVNLRCTSKGSSPAKRPLDDVDRQLAQGRHQRREAFGGGGQQAALIGRGGVEVPGRGEQGQTGQIGRPALSQRQRQDPAHAIADHQRSRAAERQNLVERAFQAPGDVVS